MAVSVATKRWTLRELHRLPDDGNKYELLDGELLVTPAPTYDHEAILSRLSRILNPYVAKNDLGLVLHARAVIQRARSEVEPDLQVGLPHAGPTKSWSTAPIPILVVEVLSPSTKRRDREHKRRYYMRVGVSEYWIVDPEARDITSIQRGHADVRFASEARWKPPGVSRALRFRIADLFD